ncbi:alpha/beta fold hydrolase [Umezawaea sp. Da 62-37]|uniref:thioesterase II family protein n=1 Tax=Umezawaea sp. Da 62-37 TaxID=3075927 RepID=UPI0028F6F7E1|nr:alpha/beta fold hydrolase [Umezawaea sp. Da 62-37]WNV87531.1 alpha/beta fold hydrolase [Umezawaea sp. Da 62-37]
MIAFFPGAGSFGGASPPRARTVKYPGRYGTDPTSSFDDLVRSCAKQADTVLFGHSFGAYVAFAVASALGDEVTALVVSGANARVHVPEQATTTPSDTATYLDAVDPRALADAPSDEWREIIAETAMEDLRLLTGFDPAAVEPVRCPIFAVRGDQDPLTSDEGIRAWGSRTSGPFTEHVFPGGHSDFLTGDELASWLASPFGPEAAAREVPE